MLIELPMNSYSNSYDRCARISQRGYKLMQGTIKRFERKHPELTNTTTIAR